MILLWLKAVRLCLIDDFVGFAQAELVGDFREEEVKVGFHCFWVLGLLLLFFSVILFLQFLGDVSRDNLDIFCGSVCRDHVADAVATHLGHCTLNAPVAFRFLVRLHPVLDCNRKIGPDIADIGEVQCGVLIFHAVSVP